MLCVHVYAIELFYLLMQKWRGRNLMTSFARLWGRFLFQDRGILPAKNLLYLLFSSGLVLFIISFFRFGLIICSGFILFIAVASLLDLLLSPDRRGLHLERERAEDVERYREAQIKL